MLKRTIATLIVLVGMFTIVGCESTEEKEAYENHLAILECAEADAQFIKENNYMNEQFAEVVFSLIEQHSLNRDWEIGIESVEEYVCELYTILFTNDARREEMINITITTYDTRMRKYHTCDKSIIDTYVTDEQMKNNISFKLMEQVGLLNVGDYRIEIEKLEDFDWSVDAHIISNHTGQEVFLITAERSGNTTIQVMN